MARARENLVGALFELNAARVNYARATGTLDSLVQGHVKPFELMDAQQSINGSGRRAELKRNARSEIWMRRSSR